MEKVKEVAKALGVLPQLRLAYRVIKPDGKEGGIEGTGPHRVRFLEEPKVVMGKDEDEKPRKELRFKVMDEGNEYYWFVPITDKEGEPHYLIERLMHVGVGEERILEMRRRGIRNYVEVRKTDEEAGLEAEGVVP